MKNKIRKEIVVKAANAHNLQNIDIKIPHNSFTVITGISGSGKSSLAFDTIFREGQRRYLESFSGYARQFLGKIGKADVESITGLLPAISIDQKTTTSSPRSTVGTLTEIYDLLRLLHARLGKSHNPELKLDRSLFSFNSPRGACPACKGLGVQDRIDPNLLIADKNKSIREGCFVMTTPSGYIVYSQVTMDVLNDVCNSEEFSVDIPWKDLSEEQKNIILRGSTKLKVPFGKHTLESRLKWSGITAKPREEGFYTGILTIMEDILKRDRNDNILRFARSIKCPECNGTRLNSDALSVLFHKKNIADLTKMSLKQLSIFIKDIELLDNEAKVASAIFSDIQKRLNILSELGLDYLSLDRESTTLSGGEAQRLRLAGQTLGSLQNVLYVLDEPSIGLHPVHNRAMISALRDLKNQGNTLLVVEHDEEFIRQSHYLVDIGPKAGTEGGKVIYSGETTDFFQNKFEESETWNLLHKKEDLLKLSHNRLGNGNSLKIFGAEENNLKNLDVEFKLGCLNVVCGVSGSGKSSLVENILGKHLRRELHRAKDFPGKFNSLTGIEFIDKVIDIDQKPIGRTPRSNPATYTKLFDQIRKLFSEQDLAIKNGWKANRFSFNTKGGRCEVCQGAGVQQVGMHFLENIATVCPRCGGKRFNEETLKVTYRDKNINEVLALTVDEAALLFKDQSKIMQYLSTLRQVGLGYITLGQPSTTISGGEAQRIKLASELSKPNTGKTLYILDEPTTGLHLYDVKQLLDALHKLVDSGNSVIIIEHHEEVIFSADHLIELGPASGSEGGELIFSGSPGTMFSSVNSIYKKALNIDYQHVSRETNAASEHITIKNASTHNLKNISLKIPHNKLTVITGVSGSGKSSLAFDTIFAEGHRRFTESLSTYARRFMKNVSQPAVDEITGLSPTIAIKQRSGNSNSRSTVGTFSEIYDLLRLLFSRVAIVPCSNCKVLIESEICPHCGEHLTRPLSNRFAFNHDAGACPVCSGLSIILKPDPIKLVTNPGLSLFEGALDGSKTGKFYGDPHGQYLAILDSVAEQYGYDFHKPWNKLNDKLKMISMFGCGDEEFKVNWKYKRKNREGEHKFTARWLGFCGYIQEEYDRKKLDKRGEAMLNLFSEHQCEACAGSGLRRESLAYSFAGMNIHQFTKMELVVMNLKFTNILENPVSFQLSEVSQKISAEIIPLILTKTNELINLGLGYLSLSRRTKTLSGGELQHLRLASYLLGSLSGITYVLDEPTLGLHPRDSVNLIASLKKLTARDNTVLVVEHDRDLISAADNLIELGPLAGESGGEILYQGVVKNLPIQTETGKYLHLEYPINSYNDDFIEFLIVKGANANNLKSIDVKIPQKSLTVISGVSGSGKSSLLHQVIYPSLLMKKPVNSLNIEGYEDLGNVILMDQSAVTNSSVSTPATFTKAFDYIRKIFANLEESKTQNLKAANFSYLNKQAQCPNCKGRGSIKISMDFLSDIESVCDLCQGKRYKDVILKIKYMGKSISEVLEMTIQEAETLFQQDQKIYKILSKLSKVGLGYLKLGQPLNTVSGGEAQRLKLAKALLDSKQDAGNVYLLDEPTTGLHFSDVANLMRILRELTEAGNSVILVEHNTDVIKQADWVIDLGPEGGDGGGEIIAATYPKDLKEIPESLTGKYL